MLVVSFVALAVLWPRPKLEAADWQLLPLGLGRVGPALRLRAQAGS